MTDVAMAARVQAPGARALLEIEGLQAWYGESHILHGVNLEVLEGEVVTLLGRNGAGKTTTMKSIMGIVPRRTGPITMTAVRKRNPSARLHQRRCMTTAASMEQALAAAAPPVAA